MNESYATDQLKATLDEEGLILFVQALAGTRVYISHNWKDDHEVVKAIGRDRADKLSREMAPAHIRVPLLRRERALYYRAAGLTNGQIARNLGITETAVQKIFKREGGLPERPKRVKSPTQLELL